MSQEPAIAAGVSTLVGTSDRLGFTLFLAIVIHAMAIFGITFTLPDSNSVAPTLEITLANHRSEQAPDSAEFLAQHNQLASGTDEQNRELAAEQPAEFAAPDVRQISPAPQVKASITSTAQQAQQVTTVASATHQVNFQEEAPQDPEQAREGEAEDAPMVNPEVASLQAKLAHQRQEYAQRPRIRRLTSVATRSSADAAYLHQWATQVELVGNQNYPEEALQQRITGKLQMAVTLNPNGTIRELRLTEPSGIGLLDQAALQIVRLASPFDPFPDEMRKNTDQLVIIRTWSFEIDGLSTAQ